VTGDSIHVNALGGTRVLHRCTRIRHCSALSVRAGASRPSSDLITVRAAGVMVMISHRLRLLTG